MYDSSLEENRRKNFTIAELLDKAAVEFSELDQNGSVILKRGIDLTWVWSGTAPNRVMTLTATGGGVTLTNTRKNQIQTFLNNRFGAGKVIFVNN